MLQNNRVTFTCFTGSCYFKISDLAGRIIQEVNMKSASQNEFIVKSQGIYFLPVIDKSGNTITEKISILGGIFGRAKCPI